MADKSTLLLAAVAFTILVLGIPGVAHARELRRIRATDGPIAMLLARGSAASPLFRELVAMLEQSDVIAHVVWRDRAGRGRGTMHFVTRAGEYRYVRITLNGQMTRDRAVAMLGHELQHARELANAPWVASVDAYRRLYIAIGHASCDKAGTCFDTTAADDVGLQVFAELQHPSRRTRRIRAE